MKNKLLKALFIGTFLFQCVYSTSAMAGSTGAPEKSQRLRRADAVESFREYAANCNADCMSKTGTFGSIASTKIAPGHYRCKCGQPPVACPAPSDTKQKGCHFHYGKYCPVGMAQCGGKNPGTRSAGCGASKRDGAICCCS